MIDFEKMIQSLNSASVEFIIVGGAAAIAHGSSRLTQDLDIVYLRSPENIQALVKAVSELRPSLRGAPTGLPFLFDAKTVSNGLNFTLTTSLGDLDLLGEVVGGGKYENLLPHTVMLKIFGVECKCVDLVKLIQLKNAAGRVKDFEVVAELKEIHKRGSS